MDGIEKRQQQQQVVVFPPSAHTWWWWWFFVYEISVHKQKMVNRWARRYRVRYGQMAYLAGEFAFLRANRQSYTRFGLFNWARNYNKTNLPASGCCVIGNRVGRRPSNVKNQNIYFALPPAEKSFRVLFICDNYAEQRVHLYNAEFTFRFVFLAVHVFVLPSGAQRKREVLKSYLIIIQ